MVDILDTVNLICELADAKDLMDKLVEYYSAIKKNKIMAFAGEWMKLENIMLSEVSQSQKNKGRMIH